MALNAFPGAAPPGQRPHIAEHEEGCPRSGQCNANAIVHRQETDSVVVHHDILLRRFCRSNQRQQNDPLLASLVIVQHGNRDATIAELCYCGFLSRQLFGLTGVRGEYDDIGFRATGGQQAIASGSDLLRFTDIGSRWTNLEVGQRERERTRY